MIPLEAMHFHRASRLVRHVIELLLGKHSVVRHHFDSQHVTHFLARAIELPRCLEAPHSMERVCQPVGTVRDSALRLTYQRQRSSFGPQSGFGIGDGNLPCSAKEQSAYVVREHEGSVVAQGPACKCSKGSPIGLGSIH